MEKKLQKEEERKVRKLSSKEVNELCWYKEVCNDIENKGCRGCAKYIETKFLMEHSGLPKAKQKAIRLEPKTDNDEKAFEKLDNIKHNMREFVEDGNNLYICSNCTGNGKTSWAIKLMHNYFGQISVGNGLRVRALFVHVPTLLLDLKDFNNPLPKTYKQQLRECDLVVWDDIASTELSAYDYSQLLALIDYRILAEKSNIYTGNIVGEKNIQKSLGERLSSRIYKSSIIIEFDGKDRRHGRSSSTSNIK